jgi:hypothetical protein
VLVPENIKQGGNNNGSKKARAFTYFFNNKKLQEKNNVLASFAFVHARLLPKVLYC